MIRGGGEAQSLVDHCGGGGVGGFVVEASLVVDVSIPACRRKMMMMTIIQSNEMDYGLSPEGVCSKFKL